MPGTVNYVITLYSLSPAVPGPIFHRALVVAAAGPWREKGIGNREEVRFALGRAGWAAVVSGGKLWYTMPVEL